MYWEYAEGGVITDGTVLTESITLKPVFTEDVIVTIDLPEGITVSDEYSGVFQEGDKLVLPTAEQITNETGHRIIRWVDEDGNAVNEQTVLNADKTITPELSMSATVNVVMPDGLTLSGDYNTQVETGDILKLPTGEQISGVVPNGRQILGWYNTADGSIIGDKYMITDTDLTIAPYFSRRDGTAKMQQFTGNEAQYNGNDLVFPNVQGNGKPHDVYDASGNRITNEMEKFVGINRYVNSTVVGGGAGGYAELGSVLQFKGTLGKDYRFRGGAMISGGSGVIKIGETQTFFYNFQNFGDTELDFTVYGLNNGTNYEGDGVRVVLKPGESTCITFSVAYTDAYNNQVNKNAMAYFWINKEVTNMKLGLSFNVIINDTAETAAYSGITGVDLSDAYLGAAVSGLKGEEA